MSIEATTGYGSKDEFDKRMTPDPLPNDELIAALDGWWERQKIRGNWPDIERNQTSKYHTCRELIIATHIAGYDHNQITNAGPFGFIRKKKLDFGELSFCFHAGSWWISASCDLYRGQHKIETRLCNLVGLRETEAFFRELATKMYCEAKPEIPSGEQS